MRAPGEAAALTAVNLIREGHESAALEIPAREVHWLNRIQEAVETRASDENQFLADMMARLDTTTFVAADYGL